MISHYKHAWASDDHQMTGGSFAKTYTGCDYATIPVAVGGLCMGRPGLLMNLQKMNLETGENVPFTQFDSDAEEMYSFEYEGIDAEIDPDLLAYMQ